MSETASRYLTTQEKEILQHAANGLTIAQTAKKMHFSIAAMRTRRAKVVHMMDACNITQAVAFALRQRIIA